MIRREVIKSLLKPGLRDMALRKERQVVDQELEETSEYVRQFVREVELGIAEIGEEDASD